MTRPFPLPHPPADPANPALKLWLDQLRLMLIRLMPIIEASDLEGGSSDVQELEDLDDVSDATPDDNHFLIADGTDWSSSNFEKVLTSPQGGGIQVNASDQVLLALGDDSLALISTGLVTRNKGKSANEGALVVDPGSGLFMEVASQTDAGAMSAEDKRFLDTLGTAVGNGHFEEVFTATTSYVVNHNLGSRPQTTVLDSTGQETQVTVVHTSANSLTLSFKGTLTNHEVICDTAEIQGVISSEETRRFTLLMAII